MDEDYNKEQENTEALVENENAQSIEESREQPVECAEEISQEPISQEPEITKKQEPQKTQELEKKLSSFFDDEEEKKPKQIFGEKMMKNFKMPSFKFNWNIRTWPLKIMHTLREYKRVFLVSKKPDLDELSEISKISIIGILLIGAIGFILQVMFQFFV